MPVTVKCDWCGKEFTRKPSHVKERNFCSKECFDNYRRGCEPIVVNCANCGKEIEIAPSRYEKSDIFFCNRKCQGEYRRANLPEEKIAEKYEDGKSTYSLAGEYNISRTAIRNVLERKGVDRRSTSWTKEVNFEKTEDLAYVLGVYLGDGNIVDLPSEDHYRVELDVTSKSFADKFFRSVKGLGLNPHRYEHDDKRFGTHFHQRAPRVVKKDE